MSIRNMLIATAFAFASVTTAHADGLRPIEAKSIDLGEVSGVAYYTAEHDGFHVVATLAEGDAGTPIRVVSVLASGQRVVLSTPTGGCARNQPARRQRARPQGERGLELKFEVNHVLRNKEATRMSTIHLHRTTTATPEQYIAGLTDFGPGRSKLFGNSADAYLKVHHKGLFAGRRHRRLERHLGTPALRLVRSRPRCPHDDQLQCVGRRIRPHLHLHASVRRHDRH